MDFKSEILATSYKKILNISDNLLLNGLIINGNVLDEVLVMTDPNVVEDYYYAHDHRYSPVALLDDTGDVLERYEYDAYGQPYFMEPNFALLEDQQSDYNNVIFFTGRRVDFLDNGALVLQYSRNRYYDYHTGRWLTHDPWGVNPNEFQQNKFDIIGQYKESINIYEYNNTNPIYKIDPFGYESCQLYLYGVSESDPQRTKTRINYLYEMGVLNMSFAIHRFNIPDLISRMKFNDCCCIDQIHVLDHGHAFQDRDHPDYDPEENPDIYDSEQAFTTEVGGWNTLAESSFLEDICPYLCNNTILTLMGCEVGKADPSNMRVYFDACRNLFIIRACDGSVDYMEYGTWQDFIPLVFCKGTIRTFINPNLEYVGGYSFKERDQCAN